MFEDITAQRRAEQQLRIAATAFEVHVDANPKTDHLGVRRKT